MAEKAPLRPTNTRPDYQTFRCDCSHRRRLALVMLLPRRSPPSPACRSVTALHTCRVTGRLLTGRTDNDDACHNLVPERRAYPEALTRARRRLLTVHPDPTRANTPTPGSLTDEQLRVLAAHDWAPPRIAALDTNTIATAAPITRALLAESVRETLERRLTTERPNGAYDDTRAGHDAFSRGLVDDYDHGNHHLARATIRVADPGLVTCAGLSHLGLAGAIDTVAAAAINTGARLTDLTTQYIDEEKALASVGIDPWDTRSSDEPTGKADRILYVGRDGVRVHVKAGRVLVDAPGSLPAASVPKNSVTRIVLSGNVGLSAGARSWAMRSSVDVVCLSRRGSYQGTLIGAKIRGQIHVLTRIARRDETVHVADTTAHMHAWRRSLTDARTHLQAAQPGAGPHGTVPPTPSGPNRHGTPAHTQSPARTRRRRGRGRGSVAGIRRQENPRRRVRGRLPAIRHRRPPRILGVVAQTHHPLRADAGTRHRRTRLPVERGRLAMIYIIAYDIADNKRRLRVAKTLESWGYRIQESVFQLRLDTATLARVRSSLAVLISESDDVIHIYPICSSCADRADILGAAIALDDVGLCRGVW